MTTTTEAELRRQDQLQRLATAAALEEAGGMAPVPAWELAARLPQEIRLRICIANRNAFRSTAADEVRHLLAAYRRIQTTAPA